MCENFGKLLFRFYQKYTEIHIWNEVHVSTRTHGSCKAALFVKACGSGLAQNAVHESHTRCVTCARQGPEIRHEAFSELQVNVAGRI